jgi:uncharacterized protein YigE (DUF2233 family)
VNTDSIALVRIDPAQVRIRVAYNPQAPKKLSEWVNAIHPLVAINGGFFEENYKATALSITDGIASGASYQGFGGMLTVKSDGSVELVSLLEHSSSPGKDVLQAIQSFPRLVWDGQVIPKLDNEQRARRTAVAIDHTGHLLLIVSDTPLWTLAELGQWLKASDLEIVHALNLDGGPSTGLAIQAPGASVLVDSQGLLPQLLIIEEK